MHTNPYLTTPPQTVVPSIFSSTFLVLIFTTETHCHCQCHSSELSSWQFLQFWGIFIQNQNFERSSIQVSFRTKQPFSPVCLLCIRLNNIKILLLNWTTLLCPCWYGVVKWTEAMLWVSCVTGFKKKLTSAKSAQICLLVFCECMDWGPAWYKSLAQRSVQMRKFAKRRFNGFEGIVFMHAVQ